MDTNALFTQALGVGQPWHVADLRFDTEAIQLTIMVDFSPGSTVPCPSCGEPCRVHEAPPQRWRHLNFFQYLTFIEARQPRVRCQTHGVCTVTPPWARAGSRFTLLCEALIVELGRNGLTASAIGRIVGEHDTRIWRVLTHYVEEARRRASFAAVAQVGVDETSRARGHVYVTLFADLEQGRVLFVTAGKDHETLTRFKQDLVAHGGDPLRIRDFSLDMSQAFVKGIREDFPDAQITFDKFHVITLINDAVDAVRRAEQKTTPRLKDSRLIWLKNEDHLTNAERVQFDALKDSTLRTARAYRLKTTLQALYDQTPEGAPLWFRLWYFWATHSRLPEVVTVAKTLTQHLPGVLRWFDSRVTNGLLEGFNSLVQAAKARARGFRSTHRMTVVIYLLLSKLDFRLPQALPSAVHTE